MFHSHPLGYRKEDEQMNHHTANYKIVHHIRGNKYQFFCDLSGALVCTSKLIHLKTIEEELEYVWTHDCKNHFNKCHKCGRWIIDAMFNAEVLECVQCAPYEETPNFCKTCGSKIQHADRICPSCGKSIVYQGGAT